MKMNVKYVREYKNEKGNTVFVYAVKGSDKSIKAYKKSQGNFYREDDDGTGLWFTSKYIGKNGILTQSSKGKWFADMSQFEQAQSLVEQFNGGAFGEALASALVKQLLGSPIPSTEDAEEPKAIKPASEPEDLDKL
jgi:hypothetical protein